MYRLVVLSFFVFSSNAFALLNVYSSQVSSVPVGTVGTGSGLLALAKSAEPTRITRGKWYGKYVCYTSFSLATTNIRANYNIYGSADCSGSRSGNSYHMISFRSSGSCPSNTEMNPSSGICEEPTCDLLSGKDAPWPSGPVPDDGKGMGASRQSCDTSNRCEVLSGYRAANGSMVKDSFYTGADCPADGDYSQCPYYGGCGSGGEQPDLEDPYEGCKKPYVESPFVCPKDTDGDGKPNPDAPFDDKAICEHDSSGKFSCRLGSYDLASPDPLPTTPTEPDIDIDNPSNIPGAAGDPATIQPVDPVTEVTEPEPTPDSNTDVVKAVVSMNKDFNKSLNDLNIDINKSQADINTELDRLNKNVVNNSNAIQGLAQTNIDIYKNTKQLIQGVEISVKQGANATVSAISKGFRVTNQNLDSMGESLDDIKDSLDGISSVDTSSAGTSGSCIKTETCTGYYTSEYPNGLSGVANAHFQSIKANVLDGFVNTFGNLDLSNAKRPSFTIPVLDFGNYNIEDYLNLDWIFGFVRFCLIFTAIATARKNILGG